MLVSLDSQNLRWGHNSGEKEQITSMAALIMRTEGRRDPGDSDRLWARFVGKIETQQYERDGSNDQEHHTESCNTVGPHERLPCR